ncbi:hypothetical protein COCOBI_05-5360 [Coccomyxa sp. Obi]|nr:hypothetical protein COCOBI_05-5360 [Coccomyxa sp. Obi]
MGNCRGGTEPNGPPKSWKNLFCTVSGEFGINDVRDLLPGMCDDDIAACFCNGTYGWESPYEGSGPHSYPPRRQGRPMGLHCQPNKGDDGTPLHWGQHDPAELFGPDTGWCEAAAPNTRCECFLDGMGGDYCDQPHEQTCINQCSGHGTCYLGFCKCDPGYFGHDCANRAAGVPASAGVNFTERPWLSELVSAAEQAEQRRRPLIYVYDLPAEFNSRMLQYRLSKRECVWRQFTDSNQSFINTWTYSIENAFHERLLQANTVAAHMSPLCLSSAARLGIRSSEHRTLDPEEADFFYMPVYTSCFLHPVWGYVDHPW